MCFLWGRNLSLFINYMNRSVVWQVISDVFGPDAAWYVTSRHRADSHGMCAGLDVGMMTSFS